MNTKERRKRPHLSKKTKFSTLQRMYFLRDKEESIMRVFLLRVAGEFITLVISLFHT